MDFSGNETECAFGNGDKGTCLNRKNLLKLAKKILPKHTGSVPSLIGMLRTKTKCSDDKCVLESPVVRNELSAEVIEKIEKETFKPRGPAHSTAWLTNRDIDTILDQCVEVFPQRHFYHIPFQMSDFNTVAIHPDKDSNLKCMCVYDKIKDGFDTFGVIINTDKSTGSGIHWFAVFIEHMPSQITIEYYNSAGSSPLASVQKWIEYQYSHLTSKGFPTKIVIHRINHQSDSYNCGIYSLYYIISRLSGVDYTWFQDNDISTSKMNEFRRYLYRD